MCFLVLFLSLPERGSVFFWQVFGHASFEGPRRLALQISRVAAVRRHQFVRRTYKGGKRETSNQERERELFKTCKEEEEDHTYNGWRAVSLSPSDRE